VRIQKLFIGLLIAAPAMNLISCVEHIDCQSSANLEYYNIGRDNAIADNDADYNRGYIQGVEAGEALAYDQGFDAGFLETYWTAYDRAEDQNYHSAYDEGRIGGYLHPDYYVGRRDGIEWGRFDGDEDGYYDGYDVGYQDGFWECGWGSDSTKARNTCEAKGYQAHRNNRSYANGRSAGISAGKLLNSNSYEIGRLEGRAAGTYYGQIDGAKDGYQAGFADGAYDLGFDIGYANSYEIAFFRAFREGYADGYHDACYGGADDFGHFEGLLKKLSEKSSEPNTSEFGEHWMKRKEAIFELKETTRKGLLKKFRSESPLKKEVWLTK
jgi:hypothetical protein